MYAENSYGVQDAGGFAGTVGVLHGDCSFQNLYYKGNITTKKSDIIFSETDFWQGEQGFGYQSYAESWQCINCISAFENEIIVRNVDLSEKNETTKYDINNYSAIFRDTLHFDENYWIFYEDKLPRLSMEMSESINPDEPNYKYIFSIQPPSTTTIRNNDGIILHANIEGNVPEGSYIVWTSNNNNFSEDADGNELEIIAKNKGYTTFTATLYDVNRNELARDSIEMYSKSGFFDKIGGFFRSLFGLDKIYEN